MSPPPATPPTRRSLPSPRRARRKARTRREIFEAALALFRERGFEAVTVGAICAAADVAKGTFFLHFPSKAALLVEWDRQLAGEVAARLRDHRGSALAQYRTLLEHLERRGPRADQQGALLRAALAADEVEPAPADAGPRLRAVVEELVVRGQQRGELRRNVSPRLAAELFLAASAAVLSDAGAGGARRDQTRNELLHALLHGLHQGKPRVRWSPTTA